METDSSFRAKHGQWQDLQAENSQIRLEITQGLDSLLEEFWIEKTLLVVLERLHFSQQDFAEWIIMHASRGHK